MSASWSKKDRINAWLWVLPLTTAICDITKGSFQELSTFSAYQNLKKATEFKEELY